MRPYGSPEELERRRVHALALLRQGLPPVEVARRVGVDRRSLRRWKRAADRRGDVGVRAKPAAGRPPKLNPDHKRRLAVLLAAGARAAGFDSDLWTCPRVALLITHHFGVRYHVDHVGRLLRDLDLGVHGACAAPMEHERGAVHHHRQLERARPRAQVHPVGQA